MASRGLLQPLIAGEGEVHADLLASFTFHTTPPSVLLKLRQLGVKIPPQRIRQAAITHDDVRAFKLFLDEEDTTALHHQLTDYVQFRAFKVASYCLDNGSSPPTYLPHPALALFNPQEEVERALGTALTDVSASTLRTLYSTLRWLYHRLFRLEVTSILALLRALSCAPQHAQRFLNTREGTPFVSRLLAELGFSVYFQIICLFLSEEGAHQLLFPLHEADSQRLSSLNLSDSMKRLLCIDPYR